MAGHSKWANIRFRKAAQDSKRGKVFTKLIREITVAARFGGPDIGRNPRLNLAVTKARKSNMKRDVIDKAIARGTGDSEGSDFFEVRYEGYGPAGVAVMVDCLTDNRNRTVAEVRHLFNKHGGNLGTDGSVSYLFTEIGQFIFPPGCSAETIFDIALEAGADDVITNDDGSVEVLTSVADFVAVRDAFTAQELEAEIAEMDMRASLSVPLSVEDSEKLLLLLEMLEDLDDVQAVHSNAEIPEEALE